MDFNKPVNDLTATDLQAVLGVAEGHRLEYKRDAYSRSDEDTREMLRDVCSFANSGGGYLLIGVDADKEQRANGLPGIEKGAEEASRMMSSINASIEERIIGLNVGIVPVAQGRDVLVWSIPRSTRSPHQVTFRGLYQCWKRHGIQKAVMTIEEIREACVRVENLRRSLEDFMKERQTELLQHTDDARVIVMTATPLVVKDEVVDTADRRYRTLLRDPPRIRPSGFGYHGSDARPSLYGLEAGKSNEYVQLFRNGHLEMRRTLAPLNDKHPHDLNPWSVAENPLAFLLLYQAIADQAGLQEPVVVWAAIKNAAGTSLTNGLDRGRGTWAERRNIQLPPFQFPHPIQPGKIAKHVADRIWNAYGLESCALFTKDGEFNPKGIDSNWL